MEIPELSKARDVPGFEKNTQRWVIFPRTSYMNHRIIFERNTNVLPEVFSKSGLNKVEGEDGNLAIATGGISYTYVKEALALLGVKDVPVLKIGTPYPFPADLASEFMQSKSHILVVEELDPVIEDALLHIKAA